MRSVHRAAKQKCRRWLPDRLLQYTHFTAHHACCWLFETHAHHNNCARRTTKKISVTYPVWTTARNCAQHSLSLSANQSQHWTHKHTLQEVTAAQPPSAGDKCTRLSFLLWSSLNCNSQQTPGALSNGNWYHLLKTRPDMNNNACWLKKKQQTECI